MNDFIKYSESKNPASSLIKGEIKSATIQSDSFVLSQSQQKDFIDSISDTVVQSNVNDIQFYNEPNTGYLEEIKGNENNLPVNVRNNQNHDWMTILLLVAFVLMVSVRAGFQKYFGTLFRSVVNYSTSFRMFREKNDSFLHAAFRLEVLYYIIFSVFIYQVLVMLQFEHQTNGILFYGKIAGFIVFYYLLKKFVYWLIGIAFASGTETSEFLFNIDNYNRAASIVLLPVVALVAYSPFEEPQIIIFLGIIVTGFFYLMLLWRGALILLKKQFSIFYLFLYLCTLEFLPLLLIYKMVAE